LGIVLVRLRGDQLRASLAREGEHANGQLWEPMPARVPVFVRLKRWLIG
jgi:hypothetical protein